LQILYEGWVFEINPYIRYVANKMINGAQCTIAWYVEDNKILRIRKSVITKILNEMKDHFGDLVISRGDTHILLSLHIMMNRDKKQVERDDRPARRGNKTIWRRSK
jgi:hypothetical protein